MSDSDKTAKYVAFGGATAYGALRNHVLKTAGAPPQTPLKYAGAAARNLFRAAPLPVKVATVVGMAGLAGVKKMTGAKPMQDITQTLKKRTDKA